MTNAALARSNIALVSRPPAARTGLPVPPFAVANVAPSKPAAQRGRYAPNHGVSLRSRIGIGTQVTVFIVFAWVS
jgi:hypothetical protein